MKTIVVDINGTPHEIPHGSQPDFQALARWSGERYLVLASNDGDLFNVLDTSNNISKKDNERGKPFWSLKTCSKECYDQYTAFLRSKNKTPFLLAQRRFRNDFR